MKTLIIAAGIAAAALLGAPLASADHKGPQDDVLCSSNMAYRTAHPSLCVDIAVGSHGGGGAADVSDADGDGVPAYRDKDDNDPNVSRHA